MLELPGQGEQDGTVRGREFSLVQASSLANRVP